MADRLLRVQVRQENKEHIKKGKELAFQMFALSWLSSVGLQVARCIVKSYLMEGKHPVSKATNVQKGRQCVSQKWNFL